MASKKVALAFVEEIVIGFGFFTGFWMFVGFDPEALMVRKSSALFLTCSTIFFS
jgi:hypothetical protein